MRFFRLFMILSGLAVLILFMSAFQFEPDSPYAKTMAVMEDPILSPDEPEPFPWEPTPTLTVKEQLGKPKFSEKFRDGASSLGLGKGENEDDAMIFNIKNGKLTAIPKYSTGWKTWRLRPPEFADGVLTMDVRFLSCVKNDKVGLILRAPNYTDGDGYYFAFSCEGKAMIYREETLIAEGDAYDALKFFPEEPIHLEAEAVGDLLSFTVNGSRIIEVQDDAYTKGFSGLFIQPWGQNTLQAEITALEGYY